jgi:acyl-CoA reductase-like NAD-dependent aldehyde dehydrogenase
LRQGVEGQDIVFEAAGVAALITPWNWPMNQVVLKVGAALAAGCTMVLKPSEIAPMSSILFAEMIDKAGFRLVCLTWLMVMVPVLAQSYHHTRILMLCHLPAQHGPVF